MTTPRKSAPAKKAPAKKAARAKVAPAKPEPASVAARVKELETRVTQLEWCFAEQIHKARVAQARQLLNTPEMREQLERELVAKLESQFQ